MANHLDRVGQQVGDYRLRSFLGRGGFGQVYLAEQVRDHSPVALKLLHIRLSRNEELKAFINEARTIRLKHAHIVHLLDFGISGEGIPYLVMEYADRGTLRDRHPKGTQVPLPLVVDYAQQVGEALQYAHEQRLIHRDVKPQNMLLRADETILLSDFGLVAVAHGSDSESPHQEVVGTMAYMAPEQIQGQAIASSDQYSLGVVVYEWITGRRPFEGTAPEVGMQHMMKSPPSLVAQVPTLSRAIEEAVLKALAKDPKDRFATVQDFTVALEQAVQGALAMKDQYKTSPIACLEPVLSPDAGNLPVATSCPGPTLKRRVDWDDALIVPSFYGREQELTQLIQWVVQQRCRVVSLLGMGGIGKSALAVSMMYRQSEQFEVVIFRSLRDAPSCEVLLDDCLQALSPQPLELRPSTLEQRLSLLLSHLRKVRALVVLDNLECLLEEGDPRGHFRPGFEGYGRLLHRVAETSHQSCLLLTSREKPADLRLLESKYSSVRALRLTGLDITACQQLLVEKGLVGTAMEQESLTLAYAGNPLALKVVAETIIDLFGGEIGPFLAEGTVLFSSINDLLGEQFARLSTLEQSVLCWLAIMRESVTLQELLALFVPPLPRRQVLLEAIDSLRRRSLIERGKRSGSFTLQSVVLEYVTAVLVVDASREIQQHQLDRLIRHSLCQAHAKEYARQTQERLLVSPLLAELQGTYPSRAEREKRLLSLLDALREQDDDAQGYGPANLIALLRLLRGHLSGLDLSNLSIRSAYLQGIEMHDTNLARALIRDTTFTEALDAIWAVAVSPNGRWWATGSRRGEVRIWHGESQTLHLVWQAHTDIIPSLAFSPDEHFLATGSWDGSVKLWNMGAIPCGGQGLGLSGSHGDKRRGALLWMGEHTNAISGVAFSPDGSMLASGGRDTMVRLWDTKTGTHLQTLHHSGSVYAVAWSPDGQLLATGDSNGRIRLWQIEMPQPCTCMQTFSEHTNWVMGLAFAPDGRTLASGSWDHTVKLWDIASGRMLQTLEAHTDKVHSLSWSPDGQTLASCSVDKTIRFWDVEQDSWRRATRRCRAVLYDHTSAVYDLCFTPDSSHLLSGSEDGTLHVWEVESCQCTRVIQGYAISFSDIDWSPDGTQLISGGTDGVVTIWDAIGDVPPRALYGHSWIVWGVGWSRDGRFLASSEHAAIHLWDPISGACLQKLQEPVASSLVVAWSPDGQQLACGTLMHGVQVLDLTTGHLRWPVRAHSAAIRYANWSPDGTRLTAGSDEGTVYLWDATDGTLLRQLQGHHGVVMRVVWSPDGRLLASCGGSSGNGELFVWDGEGGERVQTFMGHPGVVNALAWSSGGDRLITGGGDGVLRWWDVQSGKCQLMQKAHQGTIQSLRISPDGKQLASCGDDGAIMIWNLERNAHLRTLRYDRPYERLNITGIRGLNEAEIASLHALGAVEESAPSS